MKKAIEVQSVTKTFQKISVLDDVSFHVEQSKITGIIGRNGSGKTVLLKIICGLYLPTNGEVLIYGEKINTEKMNPHLSALVETGFLDNESGYKNIKILANLDKKIQEKDIYKVFELVGLDPSNKTKYRNYSTGMKQRLKFAQALLFCTDILILDEPFNGIDKETVALFRTILLHLKEKGHTILLTSHYQEDIDLLCDVVYEMEHGCLKEVSYEK